MAVVMVVVKVVLQCRSRLLHTIYSSQKLIWTYARRDAFAEAGRHGGSMGGGHHGHGGGQGDPPLQKWASIRYILWIETDLDLR